MKKSWVGNSNSIFKAHGATNHSKGEREKNDYYATDPIASKFLLELESDLSNILEPACGEGHLSKEFINHGKKVYGCDLVDRGFGVQYNFFDIEKWDGDIVTNPPYKYAKEFVEHALDIVDEKRKVCMFLKLTFMESKKRKQLFINHPPKTIYVSSSRIACAKNGDFNEIKKNGGIAVAYAWYVWEKGYKGDTKVKWFN